MASEAPRPAAERRLTRVYTVLYLGDGVRDVEGLSVAGMNALMELLAAMQLAPWNFADPANGNMPTIPFGPNREGQLTVMIWDQDRILYVTQVQWAGD